MKQVDSKSTVESFLIKVQTVIKSKSFNINKNFYLQMLRSSYSENHIHTNKSTMIELDYRLKDVVNEIALLTVENYKETFIDNKPGNLKPFYCFIKSIKGKQVYIKFKINEKQADNIFCISFHFVEFNVKETDLPYSK